MNRHLLFIALTASVLSAMFPQLMYGQEGEVVADQNDVDSVIIALTRLVVNDLILDVNDQVPDVNEQILDVNVPILELHYKVINNSEQDVWILKSIDFLESGFEAYVTEDNKTLLIRRRLDVPTIAIWMGAPYGWYSRLRPGEQWIETLKLDLPTIPS